MRRPARHGVSRTTWSTDASRCLALGHHTLSTCCRMPGVPSHALEVLLEPWMLTHTGACHGACPPHSGPYEALHTCALPITHLPLGQAARRLLGAEVCIMGLQAHSLAAEVVQLASRRAPGAGFPNLRLRMGSRVPLGGEELQVRCLLGPRPGLQSPGQMLVLPACGRGFA